MNVKTYARLVPEGEIDELHDTARRAARSGDAKQALHALLTAMLHSHAREASYERVAALASQVFQRLGQPREALTCAWYAGPASRQHELLSAVPPLDRARTYMLWATAAPNAGELYSNAAAELEGQGLLVRAAICYEHAKDIAAARTLWSRLAQMLDGPGVDPYAAGLARFNLARMSKKAGDLRSAREATVAAVHRLEEAADHFESIGQRERAFDCWHVLIAIGELTRTFEHVLEGSVNAIRILSEDNLRTHALRLYEHAVELAEEASEYAAAASLAREMTDYSRKQGMLSVANLGTLRQAELWERAAERALERGAPAQMVENALVASLLANAELGQYADVGALYAQLQELELDESRKRHYARAARRYTASQNQQLEARGLDDRLGQHVAPPDVWHVDLIEWEEKGSAAEACADVLLDPVDEGDRITRRAALMGRLVGLAAEAAPPAEARLAYTTLAKALAPIGLYVLLAPLEALYQSPDADVRLAAVNTLGRYFYKRTFVTLEQALRDEDPRVVEQATEAIKGLRFEHAFDPLSRIYRTASSSAARVAALQALSRLDLVEAAELMLGALEHAGPNERKAAIEALGKDRGSRFEGLARAAYPRASKRLRGAIKKVFTSRGIPI